MDHSTETKFKEGWGEGGVSWQSAWFAFTDEQIQFGFRLRGWKETIFFGGDHYFCLSGFEFELF